MAEKENPSGWRAAPGRDETEHFQSTTMWACRQAVKIALPYIATIATATKFTNRKSLFLDRLVVIAEGGQP